MITTNTDEEHGHRRAARSRQAGTQREHPQRSRPRLSPHRARSMRSEPSAECLIATVATVRRRQQHVRPDGHHRKHPPLRHSHPGKRHRLAHLHPPECNSTPSGTTGPRPARTPPRRRPWSTSCSQVRPVPLGRVRQRLHGRAQRGGVADVPQQRRACRRSAATARRRTSSGRTAARRSPGRPARCGATAAIEQPDASSAAAASSAAISEPERAAAGSATPNPNLATARISDARADHDGQVDQRAGRRARRAGPHRRGLQPAQDAPLPVAGQHRRQRG